MRHFSDRGLLVLLAAIAVLFPALPAAAQECQDTCSVQMPSTCISGIHFPVNWTFSSSCQTNFGYYTMEWGDGQLTSQDNQSPPHNMCSVYYTAGSYRWKFHYVGNHPNQYVRELCTAEGDTVIQDCKLTLEVEAKRRAGSDPITIDLKSKIAEQNCNCGTLVGTYKYAWRFYGNKPCPGCEIGTSEEANPSFTYPPYPNLVPWWDLTVQKCYPISFSPSSYCPTSENCSYWSRVFAEGPVLPCLTMKNLTVCGDDVLNTAGSNVYTFTGNVQINNLLFFTGNVTVEVDGEGAATGTLTTSGDVFVVGKPGNATLFKGPSLSFLINGENKTLTPTWAGGEMGFTLAGMRLMGDQKPVTLTDSGVQTQSTFFVGFESLTLASFKATVLFPKGDYKRLVGMEMINGRITEGIQFLQMIATYDPETEVFSGTGSIGFPFLGTWFVSATIRVKEHCADQYAGVNGFDISVGLPDPIPIGTTGLGIAGFTLKVDNTCDPPKFFIYFGGDFGIAGVPGEVFTLSQAGLGYQRPHTLVFEAGTLYFLGYPMGNLAGRAISKPGFEGAYFKGWVNFASIFEADVRGYLNQSKPLKSTISGGASGKLQIPKFYCAWINLPCRALRAAISSTVGLPCTLNYVEMDMFVKLEPGKTEAMFRGMQKLGPIDVALVLQYGAEGFSLLVGPNYADVWEVRGAATLSADGVERSVTLPAPVSQAIFAVGANAETSPLPSIYLKTPGGETITPSTAGSFPGVSYVGDEEGKVALFRLDVADTGTWTLGVENLVAADVTFNCLVPAPAPATVFESVTKTGDAVEIQASVTPASDKTKVSFLFATDSEGSDPGWIADYLPATTGTVGATWDLTGLDSGTYYLIARTDDGMNAPVMTVYPQPVAVDQGLVLPPTGLTGRRMGTSIILSWTPSATAGASLHQVLYTDAPEKPGYPMVKAAVLQDGATLENMDAQKAYKFCAVAYDTEGNRSLESAPWTSWKPGGIPGDCDGSGTVSIGEVQKAINMFLGTLAPDCGVDCNGDGMVSIGEVQKVINAFLGLASSC